MLRVSPFPALMARITVEAGLAIAAHEHVVVSSQPRGARSALKHPQVVWCMLNLGTGPVTTFWPTVE